MITYSNCSPFDAIPPRPYRMDNLHHVELQGHGGGHNGDGALQQRTTDKNGPDEYDRRVPHLYTCTPASHIYLWAYILQTVHGLY
jgi:hypothetical protein